MCYGESDSTHTYSSQSWSDKLARDGGFSHSGNRGTGENLASSTGYWSDSQLIEDNLYGVKMWYDEIVDYEGFLKGSKSWGVIGHFSQVIWQGSKEVNCGFAKRGRTSILTCQYYPPGNYGGMFEKYVQPLMSSGDFSKTPDTTAVMEKVAREARNGGQDEEEENDDREDYEYDEEEYEEEYERDRDHKDSSSSGSTVIWILLGLALVCVVGGIVAYFWFRDVVMETLLILTGRKPF